MHMRHAPPPPPLAILHRFLDHRYHDLIYEPQHVDPMKKKEPRLAKAAPSLTFVHFTDDPSKIDAQRQKLVRSRATSASHKDPSRKAKTSRRYVPLRRGSAVTPTTQPPSALFQAHDQQILATRSLQVQHLGAGRTDPFAAFPVPSKPWYNWVLFDYYVNVHLPPGIQVVQESAAEGHAYICWQMREAIGEPCLFYMQLLNACTPLVVEGRVPQTVVIWLRGQLVASINEAISNPDRAFSTATLIAIASIALHERLFGDADLAVNVHGRAFSRMIEMRGGVKTLAVPRIGFRLLQWTDSILSASNGHKSNSELLSAWAPESIRLRHPGYSIPEADEGEGDEVDPQNAEQACWSSYNSILGAETDQYGPQ